MHSIVPTRRCHEVAEKIKTNPYLCALEQGDTSVKAFLMSQRGFLWAVDQWTVALAIILTKIPGAKRRAVIVRNLYDEHGDGDLSNAHVNTFERFMTSFGEETSFVQSPEVKEFNAQLQKELVENDWECGIAILAIIELMYVHISSVISRYALEHLGDAELHHYTVHSELDITHAQELLDLLDCKDRINYEQGFEIGFRLFDDLYRKMAETIDRT